MREMMSEVLAPPCLLPPTYSPFPLMATFNCGYGWSLGIVYCPLFFGYCFFGVTLIYFNNRGIIISQIAFAVVYCVTIVATEFSCSIANCTKAHSCLPPEPRSYLYFFRTIENLFILIGSEQRHNPTMSKMSHNSLFL